MHACRYFVTFDFAVELRATCHHGPINAVVFPTNCSDLFVTCSVNDIRVRTTDDTQAVDKQDSLAGRESGASLTGRQPPAWPRFCGVT